MELDFIATLQDVAVLFSLIVIGFIAGRVGLITEKGQKDITQLTLNITMPATIFMAMQLPMNKERLHTSFIIIGLMILIYAFMFTFGGLVSKRLPLTPGQKDIFQTATLLSNTSFMGYPIVGSLLGDEALFYAVVGAGFIFEVVSWSVGVYLTGRHGTETTEFNWKKIVFSPGVLSILVGLVFFAFQIHLSFNVAGHEIYAIEKVLRTLAPATSPLAMIIIGLILSRSNIQEALQNKVLYLASAIKLLIVPTIVTFALKAFGFSGPTLVIPVIMIAMPTASYVAMFSANAGNDSKFASQLVFMSSLLSIITIPLITLLF